MCFMDQIDAKFAWIIVFLLIKPNNSGLYQGEISKYLILIIFQVPVPGRVPWLRNDNIIHLAILQ